METVVFVIMVLASFNFILKQSFCKVWHVWVISSLSALFVGSMWSYASEQSKMQITSCLHDSALMLDISVLITIEVVLQIAYSILAVYISTHGAIKPRTLLIYRLLRFFPGLLIFPVLFSSLVWLIFEFTGYSFSLISWSLAALVLLMIPLLTYIIKWVLPEKELRLELLYYINILVAILGVIATVNGRTAVVGMGDIDWMALLSVVALVVVFGIVGEALRRVKNNKKI